jgi:hypothetical protein
MKTSTRWLTRAALLTLVAAVVFGGSITSEADAQGLTWQQLQAAGWTCFPTPFGPERVVCFDPGVGRPFPGNPDPAPSYNGLLFSSSGDFLFGVHFIRDDLYHGQRCGTEPYILSVRIGYWECIRD